MMKKLLVLTLVLGMASLAGATLTLTADGPLELLPSESIVLCLVGDGAEVNFTGFITVEGPGSIDGAEVLYVGSLSSYKDAEDLAPDFGMPGAAEVIEMFAGFLGLPLTDVSGWELVDGAIPPAPTAGLLISGILFHCEGEGDAIVTVWDANFGVMDQITIKQIPEPMTMALLGLGGLFLRRRK
jgi:hypothetical protein